MAGLSARTGKTSSGLGRQGGVIFLKPRAAEGREGSEHPDSDVKWPAFSSEAQTAAERTPATRGSRPRDDR